MDKSTLQRKKNSIKLNTYAAKLTGLYKYIWTYPMHEDDDDGLF